MTFLSELNRRKVFRVAAVYAATAFVVLQAADIMLPRVGVPDWVMSLVVVLTVLGFPVALVLAWALELTAEGGIMVWSSEHAAMRRDPRFVDYLRRQGVVDLWREIGPPPDCVEDGDTVRCGMSREESDR